MHKSQTRGSLHTKPLNGLILAVILLCPSVALAAVEPDPGVQPIFNRLMQAVQANDRDAFLVDATSVMKKGLTPEIMQALSRHLGSRLKKGYQAEYLCRLNQESMQVYLWKLTFKDKGDDVLVRVVLQDGHLAGFFLQ